MRKREKKNLSIWSSLISVRLMAVCGEGLWQEVKQYGVEDKFVRVCKGLDSGVEMRVVGNGGKSRWFMVEKGLRQRCPLLPLLFNIYLMGMAKELARAQLGVKLDGCWCGVLMYADEFWWQTRAELQVMLDVVEAYVSRWKMKFNIRKSNVW